MHELQRLRRLHILLVDDDPGACERIQQALGSGFLLRSAYSLMEARQHLTEYIPDIVICEVLLGQESGLELCRFIRNTPLLRHLPIMLLTTLTTLQDKIAGFDAGADDYVIKPFDARHFKARIRLLARMKRLEQQYD
ncbi:MAG TPA: response regulator [Ktedonobacteraceae bacterium]|nr:response regulator [Ktedonobacteraceae bacterium]